jgi:hypothetical protein
VGREERTELTRTSLSPYDRKEAIEDNLLSTLSIRGERSLIEGLVVPIGSKGGIRPYAGYLEQGSRFQDHNLAKTHYFYAVFWFFISWTGDS